MRTLRVAFRDLPPGCGPQWFFRRHPAWMAKFAALVGRLRSK